MRPSYTLVITPDSTTAVITGGVKESATCVYVYKRGFMEGKKCGVKSLHGTSFCSLCTGRLKVPWQAKRMEMIRNRERKFTYSSYHMRFSGVPNFSNMRDTQTLTDITIIVEGVPFVAHKFMLVAASPFFGSLFLSQYKRVGESVTLEEISSEIFGLWLDLIYGKTIHVDDWRTAFDLFDLLERFLMLWNSDAMVTSMDIPVEDYLEYMERMNLLYVGGIPNHIVGMTKKYLNSG